MELRLPKNKVALVDDEDAPLVQGWSWCLTNGYPSRRETVRRNKSRILYLHRLVTNAPAEMEVDHINGNKLDNRKCNLRICTHAENMLNWDNKRGRSQYRGVSWDRSRKAWKAQIQVRNKNRFIGRYSIETQAAKACDLEAIKAFGLLARPNFKGDRK